MADKRISQLADRGTVANNDVVAIVVSGAVTTNKATISSIQTFMQGNLDLGVTSVGITLGSSGTDVSVTGSPIITSGNITINIPSASATARGLVTTGTQTFGGAKTFSSDILVNGVNVGRGGGSVAGNTRLGADTLISNTTGSVNTAIGQQTLSNNTTGEANAAVGIFSMLNNISGNANTANGGLSLHANTSGSVNTAIGYFSLYSNTTGSGNTAIGNVSGGLIAGGINTNSISNNSVFIGVETKAQANNQTNQIVIGYQAVGNGSNTVTIGNSSITSNKFFGRVIHADAINADESATLGQVNTTLGGFVTLGTAQTITAQKTFTTSGGADTLIVDHTSGSGIALDIAKAGNGEGLRVAKSSGSGNAVTITGGNFEAPTIVKTGGTSSQFLKADGSVDSSTYYLASNPSGFTSNVGTVTSVAASAGTGISISGSPITSSGTLNITNTAPDQVVSLTASTGISVSGSYPNFTITNTSPSSGGTVTNVTASAPLASSGGATPNLSITQASGSTNGFLSSTDWNTFNNKAPSVAGGYLPLSGGTLTGALNGTSASFTGGVNLATSSGNVGVGISSPTNGKLQINGNFGSTSSALFILDSTSGSGRSYVLAASNFSDSDFQIFISQVGAADKFAKLGTGTSTPLIFETAGTERMRITSGGYLKLREATISTSDVHILRADTLTDAVCQVTNVNASQTSDGLLTVVATRNTTNNSFFAYAYYNNGAGAFKFRVADSGNVTNTNNSYGALSDIKLKENIEDATPKLDDLLKVKVRNYNLIGDDKKQIGVIAQELEEVFPAMIDESEDFEELEVPQLDEEGNEVLNEEGEVVTEKQRVSKGTSTKSVKYSVFVPMLIKAIQELKTEIDSLKNQMQ